MPRISLLMLLIIHLAITTLGATYEPLHNIRSISVPDGPYGIRAISRRSIQSRSQPLLTGLIKRSPVPGESPNRKASASIGPVSGSTGSGRNTKAKQDPSQSPSGGGGSPRETPSESGRRSQSPSLAEGNYPPSKALIKASPNSKVDLTTGRSGWPNLRDVSPDKTHYRTGTDPDRTVGAAIAYRDGKASVQGTGQHASGWITTMDSGRGVLQSHGSGGVETKIALPGEIVKMKASSRSGRPVSMKAKMYGGHSAGEGAYGGVRAQNSPIPSPSSSESGFQSESE